MIQNYFSWFLIRKQSNKVQDRTGLNDIYTHTVCPHNRGDTHTTSIDTQNLPWLCFKPSLLHMRADHNFPDETLGPHELFSGMSLEKGTVC